MFTADEESALSKACGADNLYAYDKPDRFRLGVLGGKPQVALDGPSYESGNPNSFIRFDTCHVVARSIKAKADSGSHWLPPCSDYEIYETHVTDPHTAVLTSSLCMGIVDLMACDKPYFHCLVTEHAAWR